MNWYKRHLYAFRNPLDMMAKDLIGEIMPIARKFGDKGMFQDPAFTAIDFKLERQVPNVKDIIPFVVVFGRDEACNKECIVDGSTMPQVVADENGERRVKVNQITLIIHINPDTFSHSSLSELHANLHETIRHELEHVRKLTSLTHQDILEGKHKPDYNVIDQASNIVGHIAKMRQYLMSQGEKEPFIRGMVARAKKKRIPFGDIVNECIMMFFYQNNKEVKKQIMDHPMFGPMIAAAEDELKRKYKEKALEIYPTWKDKKDYTETIEMSEYAEDNPFSEIVEYSDR